MDICASRHDKTILFCKAVCLLIMFREISSVAYFKGVNAAGRKMDGRDVMAVAKGMRLDDTAPMTTDFPVLLAP